MPLFGRRRGIWGVVSLPVRAPVDIREPNPQPTPQGTPEAQVPATPLIVEVPHAGILVDDATRATLAVDDAAIARDADLFVDELYALAPTVGATLISTPFSRYVIDLNRGENDLDEATVEGGPREPRATRGLVWRLTSDNRRAITKPLTRAEVDRRLDLVYRPYHAALRRLIDERRRRFGFAIVLAGHSMPGTGRAGHGDPARVRADVVPGTRGRTSAAEAFIDAVESQARAAGLSVEHDTPYRGGFTTTHYGRPAENVHVVQVELARRLYMSESTLLRTPGRFEAMRGFCTDLARRLGATRP
jgi:N-formylglutamate deformylase